MQLRPGLGGRELGRIAAPGLRLAHLELTVPVDGRAARPTRVVRHLRVGVEQERVAELLLLLLLREVRRTGMPMSFSSSSTAIHWFWCIVSRAIRNESMSFMPGSSVISYSRVASTRPVDSAATLAYMSAARLPLA